MISLLSRGYYEYEFADFDKDKVYQLSVSKNLDLGRGPVISYTDLNDINQIKSNNLTGYTLFYSILISIITPQVSYKNAAVLIDILFISLLIFSCLRILAVLKLKRNLRSKFSLFFAFTPFPFNVLTSTDLILTSFFIFAILVLYEVYVTEKNSFLKLTIASLIIGFIPFIKISGVAYFIIFPFLIFLSLYESRNRQKSIRLFYIFFISIVLVVCIFYFVPFYPKAKTSIFGFYPLQLLQLDPFIQKSIFYLNPFIEKYTFYEFLKPIFASLNIVLIIYIFKYLCENKNDVFIKFLLISIFLVTIFYCFCSLVFKGENWKNPAWTYVENSRYFGGIIILLFLSGFYYFSKNKFKKINVFLFIIFLFNFLIYSKGFYNNFIKNYDLYNFEGNYSEMLAKASFISETKSNNKKLYIDLNTNSGYTKNFMFVNSDLYSYIDYLNYENFTIPNKYEIFIDYPIKDSTYVSNFIAENDYETKSQLIINNSIIKQISK